MYIVPDLHPLETDDQYAVLQHAINIAAAENKPLWLPPRPIHVSQPIELRSGVTIIQDGRQVKNADPNIGLIAVGHSAMTGDTLREVTLRGVNLHGKHVDQNQIAPALDLYHMNNCLFDRVHVRCQWHNAIKLRLSANVAIRDSFIAISGPKHALDIGTTNILEVHRNLITGGSAGHGVILTGCHAATVRLSRIEVTNRGIEIAGNSFGVTVESNYLEAVVEGILIHPNVRACRVEGNLVSLYNTANHMPTGPDYAIQHDNGPNAVVR